MNSGTINGAFLIFILSHFVSSVNNKCFFLLPVALYCIMFFSILNVVFANPGCIGIPKVMNLKCMQPGNLLVLLIFCEPIILAPIKQLLLFVGIFCCT